MTELSLTAKSILHAVTLKRYGVPYHECPDSIDQIKSDAAVVLWAAANGLTDANSAHTLYAIAGELNGIPSPSVNPQIPTYS
jgi:hypothetical protein